MNYNTHFMRKSSQVSTYFEFFKKRNVFCLAGLILLILLLPCFLPAEDFVISAQVVDQNTIRIDFEFSESLNGNDLILFRSTAELTGPNIDKVKYPVAEFLIDSGQNPTTFFDLHTAHNVMYHYLAVIRKNRAFLSAVL